MASTFYIAAKVEDMEVNDAEPLLTSSAGQPMYRPKSTGYQPDLTDFSLQ